MSNFFNDQTVQTLNEPLSKEAIKSRTGTGKTKLSYLPSFHVIAEANNIFGFGNWSTEIQHIQQVDKTIYEKDAYKAGDAPKQMVSVSYTCHIKLTVRGESGSVISHEDIGFGNGTAGNTAYGIGSVIELASKESVTDALKRCLRYYGNKFGLTLYDKDDDSAMTTAEIDKSKIVTEDQLTKLRELYEPRGIDDEWVLTALKAEHYPLDSLELMRFDWYQLALNITTQYKLDEINRDNYQSDIDRIIKLMNESANFNMLKALYLEAYDKAKAHRDKKTLLDIVRIKDEVKLNLEGKS